MGSRRMEHWEWLAGKFYPHFAIHNLAILVRLNSSQGLLCPVMFSAINEKTLYIFGICNIISIPMFVPLHPTFPLSLFTISIY